MAMRKPQSSQLKRISLLEGYDMNKVNTGFNLVLPFVPCTELYSYTEEQEFALCQKCFEEDFHSYSKLA